MNQKTNPGMPIDILHEIESALKGMDPNSLNMIVEEVEKAHQIFCLGAGRAGILLQAFCMRLNHLGCHAYLVGGVPCPPAGSGDLIVAASGSGTTPSVTAVLKRGKVAGARILAFTARESKAPIPGADLVIFVPAPSNLVNKRNTKSQQPMRTLFEQVVFLICESAICILKAKKGIGEEEMAQRHANLE
jgi:6-phospho-3-hexuloisomerase